MEIACIFNDIIRLSKLSDYQKNSMIIITKYNEFQVFVKSFWWFALNSKFFV